MKKYKYIKLISIFIMSFQIHAVNISDGNSGQVLLFPYFTVNNGFNTLIGIQNTSNQAKAIRLAFREAANGKVVFYTNLYLGPNDAWVASVKKGDEEHQFATKIKTNDESCIIPTIDELGNYFMDDQYTNINSDEYGTNVKRMHEGYIEIIEMGDLTGDSAQAVTRSDNQDLNCQLLEQAIDSESANPYWVNNINTDLTSPTGGITATVVLVNVQEGIALTQVPVALENFSQTPIHHINQAESPNLNSGMFNSQFKDSKGVLYDLDWDAGYKAVSAVLMNNQMNNEFVLDSVINANTEWIISFPTLQFYPSQATKKIVDNASLNTINCNEFDLSIYNRNSELATTNNSVVIDNLCFATNAIKFSNDQPIQSNLGIFDSRFLAMNQSNLRAENTSVFTSFENGWASVKFNQSIVHNETGNILKGLPSIGFSAQKYTNNNAQPGILANYGASFNHKKNIEVESSQPQELLPMSINKNNTGQVLIFPYYTVRNGFNSLFSVTNHSAEVKALKVRLREGKNSRSVMDFNLYLAPFDIWTAVIKSTQINDVISAHIISSDQSCTVPNTIDFDLYNSNYTFSMDDQLGNDKSRLTEGYVEIIEMGSLQGIDAQAAMFGDNNMPSDCLSLENNWQLNGKWFSDSNINLSAPSGLGEVSAIMNIIDVSNGIDFSIPATAVINYSNSIQHEIPFSETPNLSTGTNLVSLIDTESGFLDVTWNNSIDAMSSLFMSSQISSDYSIENGINAQTEIIMTYPTKQFYVDPHFAQSNDLELPIAPFTAFFEESVGHCEEFRVDVYDREQNLEVFPEQYEGLVPPLLPSIPPETPKQCWSVSILQPSSSNDDNSIFLSKLRVLDWSDPSLPNYFLDYPSIYDLQSNSGMIKSTFYEEIYGENRILIGHDKNGNQVNLYGLPVIGLAVQKYANGTLNNGHVLANYGVNSQLFSRREMTVETAKTK